MGNRRKGKVRITPSNQSEPWENRETRSLVKKHSKKVVVN